MQVSIEVQDVAAPVDLALPSNKGALYIYLAICLGGIWFFSLVPVPFQLFIIHVSPLSLQLRAAMCDFVVIDQ